MKKEYKSIINYTLLEFILIHVVYCICKLLLYDCRLLNLYIYIAVGLSLIISAILTFYKFKKKERLFFIIEPIILFIIISIYVFMNIPGIHYFAYKCDGGWFSGINYAAFICYFTCGRIIIWIIGMILKMFLLSHL